VGKTQPLTDDTGHYRLACEHLLLQMEQEALPRKRKDFYLNTAIYLSSPGGGYRPLPQARRFHKSKSRSRWNLGGNRSSKSRALAQEIYWIATGTHPWQNFPLPNVGWYATTTWDKVGDTLWFHMKKLLTGLDYKIIWHNKQFEIPAQVFIKTKAGTSQIIFKAYEQGRESFQATGLNYIGFDEQFPQEIYVEAMTRIGPGDRLRFMASLTPIEPQPWLEEKLVIEPNPKEDAVFYFPLDDNRISKGGFLKDEEIDATIESWPPEVRETRRNGKFGGFVGVIFQTFSRDIHVVSEHKEKDFFFIRPHIMLSMEVAGGIDWGGSNPFVFLWLVKIPHLDNDWYVFDELYHDFRTKGARLLRELADDIKARSARWEADPRIIVADHDPTDAREMMQYGINSVPADKTDKLAGIERMQTLLQPRKWLANPYWTQGRPQLHIAARCTNTIREMSIYRWRENTQQKDAPREPIKQDDHCVDCLRYLVALDVISVSVRGAVPIVQSSGNQRYGEPEKEMTNQQPLGGSNPSAYGLGHGVPVNIGSLNRRFG
jgi:phage terminase large subunit-like protein